MKKICLFVFLFISCDDPNQSGQQEDFIPIDEYFIYNEYFHRAPNYCKQVFKIIKKLKSA